MGGWGRRGKGEDIRRDVVKQGGGGREGSNLGEGGREGGEQCIRMNPRRHCTFISVRVSPFFLNILQGLLKERGGGRE